MTLWYGGDYNPEQWPEDVWDDDVRLMKQGGITLATVGVFSWARIEPQEGRFELDWLDRVLDRLHAGGISVDLATATASPPPWVTHTYPEVLPMTADGVRLWPGSRQHWCPSSPVYRRLAARLATVLAERYGEHPALRLWHVNNEYGCHVRRCWCDVSAQAFRVWLERRYGSVDGLNAAWGTTFWSQVYGSFDEVYPPRAAPTFINPAQLLDFDRFSSDELLQCFREERAILRRLTPDIPVTTNFLGFSERLDYWSWAPEVDVVSYDSYPDPTDPDGPARGAMSHDLARSLRQGRPWLLMEQSPSAVSWLPQNAPKAPGQQRAWSYQAIARGSDGALFFQWRQSAAGAEKFLTGLVPAAGGSGGRVWREAEQVGAELPSIAAVEGTRVEARVAIALDWDSWWSLEQPAVPGELSYREALFTWYRELFSRNVAVDFVHPSGNLGGYDLLVVPSLFVTSRATAANLDAFVERGGHLLVTYQTAVTDEHARLHPEGYLGALRGTLGVEVEELAPLRPDVTVSLVGELVPGELVPGELLPEATGTLWSEYVRAVDADVVAAFSGGHLDGRPALTRRAAGRGTAWYLATMPDTQSRGALLDHLCGLAGVGPVADVPAGVEAVRRGDLLFVLNHTGAAVELALDGTDLLTGTAARGLTLAPQGVAVLDHVAPLDDVAVLDHGDVTRTDTTERRHP